MLEEGKVQRLESVKRTLKEKMSLLQRLEGEILEGLKEEQDVCNEIVRSSDIRLNIQETISNWSETNEDYHFWGLF